jgi:hypothetical protein
LSATSRLYSLEYFVDAGPLGQPPQFRRQVLLQGLSTLLSPALESSVYLVGDVAYK